MSQFFTYVCVKTTADPYLAPRTANITILARDVADGFSAISGGRLTVGQLAFYPVQRSVPNHLLCDGREVLQTSFPELYSYLGTAEGAATDPAKFKLPNYLTTFAPATTAATETVHEGTASTPPPATPPPTDYPEREEPLWGDVDSGGRTRPLITPP